MFPYSVNPIYFCAICTHPCSTQYTILHSICQLIFMIFLKCFFRIFQLLKNAKKPLFISFYSICATCITKTKKAPFQQNCDNLFAQFIVAISLFEPTCPVHPFLCILHNFSIQFRHNSFFQKNTTNTAFSVCGFQLYIVSQKIF